MNDIKNKINKKLETIDKDKAKKVLKITGIATAVIGTGLVGYRFGMNKGVILSGAIISTVLDEHPDLREPFSKAYVETFDI